jgi:hypothetical protein
MGREGKRLPPEELLRNAENCRSMALRYHPMRQVEGASQLVANPERDPEKYSHWLAMEREALKAAAPYYSPRLHAVCYSKALPRLGPLAPSMKDVSPPY